jgi:hypothetical protein
LVQAVAHQRDHITFLQTAFKKPFSPNVFGNWFKRRCKEAACRSGLREAGATIAAQNGATPHQLMAMYSLKQPELYTRTAAQGRLAREGAQHLIVPPRTPVGLFRKKAK